MLEEVVIMFVQFFARAVFNNGTQQRAVGTTPPTTGAATTIATSEVEWNVKRIGIIIIEEKE